MSTYDTQLNDDEYELVERAWTLNLMGMSTFQIGRELDIDMRQVERYVALRRTHGPQRRKPRPPEPKLPEVPPLPYAEAVKAFEHFKGLAESAQVQIEQARSPEEAEKARGIAQQAHLMALAFHKQINKG